MKDIKLIALSFIFVLVFALLAGCAAPEVEPVSTEAAAEPVAESVTDPEIATEAPTEAEAPAETEAPGEPVRTDINLSLIATVSTLDPHNAVQSADAIITYQIYESLLFVDAQQELQPSLAVSYEVNADATEYTFSLRQGVKFTNGEELKASDVIFSYNRAVQSPFMASMIGSYDSATATDDYTVVIKLKAPDSSFPVISAAGIKIMNEKYTTEAGETIKDVPCGTGPYILESLVPDQSATLVANPDYWDGVPQIQTVNFKVITDPSSAAIALEAGEIDYLGVQPALWEQIESSGNFNTILLPSNGVGFASLNTRKSPLDDVRVRQALNYAVDRESIVAVSLEGLGAPAYTMANPDFVFGALVPTEPYSYDPDKARELLAEAGYADGLDIGTIMTISGAAALDNMAQVLQQSFAEVGVTSTVELGEANAVIADLTSGNFDVVVISINLFNEFSGWKAMFVTGSGFNSPGLSNPELDQLYVDLAATTDSTARAPIIQQIVDLENADAVYIPGYHAKIPIAWDKNLVIDQLFAAPYVKYMHWE